MRAGSFGAGVQADSCRAGFSGPALQPFQQGFSHALTAVFLQHGES